jgi:2-polyprenyl-3-methyl-5-hydroxy-6-metoxy-1,4-benzoquinol methylase
VVRTSCYFANNIHQKNGLYGLMNYARNISKNCIFKWMNLKKIDIMLLKKDYDDFVNSLHPLTYRHLIFFLNTNTAGRRIVDELLAEIQLPKPSKILDVGCGYGGLVKAFADEGHFSEGIDILPALLDIAKENLKSTNATVSRVDFMGKWDCANYYDLLCMIDVIEHVADVELAIRRAISSVKIGGFVYIKVPNYRSLDFVIEDSHTGLFGITLLGHDQAQKYLDALNKGRYSVGDYFDYKHYIYRFKRHGAELIYSRNIVASNVSLADKFGKLQQKLKKIKNCKSIPKEIRSIIISRVTSYYEEAQKLESSNDLQEFEQNVLASHWNFIFKRLE